MDELKADEMDSMTANSLEVPMDNAMVKMMESKMAGSMVIKKAGRLAWKMVLPMVAMWDLSKVWHMAVVLVVILAALSVAVTDDYLAA